MKKVDRRIKRTKQSLKDALISLIEEKELASISITDIVNKSDVNRSTFYTHFRDKDELLNCIINDLLEGMIQCMSDDSILTPPEKKQLSGACPTALQLFTYIENHSTYFKTLLNHQKLPQFMIHFSDAMYRFYLKEIKSQTNENQLINQGFFASYLSSVLVGFIYHWLVNTDMKYSSDFIAHEFTKILTMKSSIPHFTFNK